MSWPLQSPPRLRGPHGRGSGGDPSIRRRPLRWIGRGPRDGPKTFPTRIGLTAALGLGLLGAVLGTPFAASAEAQVLLLPDRSAPAVYPVSRLELSYAGDARDLPPLDDIVPVEVRLRQTDIGWAAPRPDETGTLLRIGGPDSGTVRLEPSGLSRVLAAIVEALNGEGLYGIDVRPASNDIDLETERDLRPAGSTTLHLIVHVGRIERVRTIAIGDRVRDD
ncbi:MAG TPA: hypothetical protein ENI85_12370, partial [Deltaproteobacteria bacterium]|nr:hypothetical protein [Deltaproteobacteria bacterium]